jgi:hypothetical protein
MSYELRAFTEAADSAYPHAKAHSSKLGAHIKPATFSFSISTADIL